jgi:hypothetical protein
MNKSLLLAAIMAVALAACGKDEPKKPAETKSATPPATTPAPAATPAPTPAPAPSTDAASGVTGSGAAPAVTPDAAKK